MTNTDKKNENLQEAVENILKCVAKSQDIRNYEVFANVNRIQGEGFLSEFLSGEVLNRENGEKIKVAIKRVTPRGFSLEYGNEPLFKNEIFYYSKLFPELDKFQRKHRVKNPFDHTPKYLAGHVESENNMFVAMENLKAAGYVLFNKRKYLDRKHLEYIFKTYGRFHALSFTFKQANPEKFENLTENPDFTNLVEKLSDVDGLVVQMSESYSVAVKTFDPVTEAEVIAKLKKVNDYEKTLRRVEVYKGKHKCFIHGDCWSNNMLFKYKDSGELEHMKLVDFQLPGYSSPIYDLSYFFYAGASKEDMDRLDYYLDLYYGSFSDFCRELGGNPEEILPLDILRQEWKEYALWGLFLGIQLWCPKLMEGNEIAEVLKVSGLTTAEYWDLFNIKMSEVRAGEEFKERARNLCLHAVDYGIL